MLNDEEKEKLEQEFQYALDNIVSKIKGETATAIVYSEQSMILLFKKLMLKIEKQSKEIEELKEENKKKSIVIIEYQDLYEKLQDKIKAKIEEVEQWELYNMKIPRLSTLDERLGAKIGIKYVLQSLLEKE